MDFSSVHNRHEKTVFAAVIAAAARYPGVCHDPELLADVACVALNRMPPRYIRHSADLAFFTTEKERLANVRNVDDVGRRLRLATCRHGM